LLKNYESAFPANFPTQTEVKNFVYIENLVSIDESNMAFSVTLDLISVWMDRRLAYTSTTKASLDVSGYLNSIWKPQVQITDNVKDSGT
jgi:hypothetical protein